MFYTLAMASSVVKQLVITTLKPNTSFAYIELALQLAGAILGMSTLENQMSGKIDKFYSTLCSEQI